MCVITVCILGGVDDTFRCPACQSKSTNLYMYIVEFDTFIHVCQGFDKETLFWHNRGVPKNKI